MNDQSTQGSPEWHRDAETANRRFSMAVEMYNRLSQHNYSLPHFCMKRSVAQELNKTICEFLMAAASFPTDATADVGEPLTKLAVIVGMMVPHHTCMLVDVPSEDEPWARHWRAGYDAAKTSNWPIAVDEYGRALNDHPEHTLIRHGLGLALFNVGDAKGGVQSWLGIIKATPDYDFTTMSKPFHIRGN
jgi:hypothetical protein